MSNRAITGLTRWPVLGEATLQAVERVIRSGSLLKSGQETKALETEWSAYTGAKYAIATSSCTHALHLAIRALNLKPGSRIGVPALGFVGTVHPIVHAQCTPIFFDVDLGTFNIATELIKDAKIDALVVVHLHGCPCNMTEVMRIARERAIPVVEDCCQGHGTRWESQHVGTFGNVGCFSLNEVKAVPAGQGGVIVTSDECMYERLRRLCGYGQDEDGLCRVAGFSYGLSEIPSAIAREQLLLLEERISHVNGVVELLEERLSHISGILLPKAPVSGRHTWHKYRIRVSISDRPCEAIFKSFEAASVPVTYWAKYLLPDHPAYHVNGEPVFYENGNTRSILANSFFLGTEKYPLMVQEFDVVEEMCRRINSIFEDSSYE